MKKCLIFAAVCTVLFASCKFEINDGLRIEPSSKIVKNEYKLSAFDQLEVNAIANVKFIQGSEGDYRVVLSCPDNYVMLFKFEVEKDGELEIGFVHNNTNIEATNVDVTVYAPQLRKLDNSGVASVEAERLKGDRLKVENSGVGSVYLYGLQIDDIEVDCSGVGSMELGGKADRATLECSGVGGITADKLQAKTVKADVSGVGGIKCYASERIEGNVSGVGSLTFDGKPQEKKLNRSGVGNITEL